MDASKNNRPDDNKLSMNMGDNNSRFCQNPQAPVQKGDFCESASYSNPPMEQSSLLQNPRAQQQNKDFCVDNSFKNVPQKIIECCDQQNARYSNKKAQETSCYHSQNRCETVPKFAENVEQPTLSAKQQLANPDNNNRPNTNCYESVQKVDSDRPIAVVKSIDESMFEAIGSLHRDVTKVGEKVEKVVTNVHEMSDVLDHDIMKRDQESERINRTLLESDKTTDKFKQETPTLNVFAAPKSGLRTVGHDWAPDP
ncbi:MAG: hypothetical protein GY820_41510, partial [Gammaproteobacteria bacterium]|nr:hypothetical protein [Gammaproteobacteria bacterium]